MIEISCRCGASIEVAEKGMTQVTQCEACKGQVHLLAGEVLTEGAGAGDFDLALTLLRGPDRVGEQFAFGGVCEIGIGKSEGKQLQLTGGGKVSRNHCKLVRIDFGPSRWELQDNQSTNGVYVNGERITQHTIVPGDKIVIGDYLFEARDASPVASVTTPDEAAAVTHPCPKCGKGLTSARAVFCVHCGTDLKSGKRQILSKELDEDAIHVRAENTMMLISWLIPFGLFPIASEALGTKKPLATWIITGVTALCSVAFMIAYNAKADDLEYNGETPEEMIAKLETSSGPALENLMLWSGDPQKKVQLLKDELELTKEDESRLRDELKAATPGISESALKKQIDKERQDAKTVVDSVIERQERIGFRWYQLVTHAFLHDSSSWLGLIFHFGGNLLFLLVFGLRVNELIGQWRFAVSYLLLAIGAGLGHHFMESGEYPFPMLGASGAIMGLAGMYLVLFPLQKVFMAFWLRLGIFTGFRRVSRVWKMSGFWLLIMWIAWNDILPIAFFKMLGLSGSAGGTAHWAHVGGFVTGIVLAVIWLISRQVHAHGGDLISRIIGPSAAKFINQS